MFYLRKKVEQLAQAKNVNLSSKQLSELSFLEKKFNQGKMEEKKIKEVIHNLFRYHKVYLKNWEIDKILR